MTCITKDDDRKTAEGREEAGPSDNPDGTSIFGDITLDEMCYYEDDQITNGDESDETSILERVQAAQITEGYNDEPINVLLESACHR